jgi:hypothetical protein
MYLSQFIIREDLLCERRHRVNHSESGVDLKCQKLVCSKQILFMI